MQNCDVKYIISSIDEENRQRYDYDLVQKLYLEYSSTKVNDSGTVEKLVDKFKGQTILIMAPGITIEKYKPVITKYIQDYNPIVISVNFKPCDFKTDYIFFSNAIRWEEFKGNKEESDSEKYILTSNIHTKDDKSLVINYSSLIEESSVLPDNSTIMLLNLLDQLGVSKIAIAGFDGLDEQQSNYINGTEPIRHINMTYKQINEEISNLFKNFRERVAMKINIETITPSKYS